MANWRQLLAQLVIKRNTELFPLLVFQASPPSQRAWSESFPPNQGIGDFFRICDGGFISCQYNWFPIGEIESATIKWIEHLSDYHGDGRPILKPSQHFELALDASGCPLVWDAHTDSMFTFFFKGGEWEPLHQSFEDFMTHLFTPTKEAKSDTLWVEALDQLNSY